MRVDRTPFLFDLTRFAKISVTDYARSSRCLRIFEFNKSRLRETAEIFGPPEERYVIER